MKVQKNYSPWRAFSEKISTFLATPKKSFFAQRKWQRQGNCFLSWPNMPKRLLSVQSGFSLPPKIDVKKIENFLRRHKARQEIKPMLNNPFDDWRGWNMQQALAVDKMATLISETVSDIKALELIHICHKKG